LIAALAVTPVLVLAACGDDDGSSTDDFVADADAGCVESAKEINELYAAEGLPQSFEEAVALLDKRLPISEEGVQKASELEAPDDVADDYDEYLAQRETFIDLLRQQLQAGKAGDEDKFNGFNAQLDETSDAIDAAGEQVGLEACAQILPDDQVEEVTTVLEEGIKSDPANCTERYTDTFVEAIGGPDACRESESDSSNDPESVEVSDVKGIDEVYATAEAVPSGGPNDGKTLLVELVFEDDTWKVDSVTPVSG
jgi:hypothetical protein